jgi:hypothetical protein
MPLPHAITAGITLSVITDGSLPQRNREDPAPCRVFLRGCVEIRVQPTGQIADRID